MSSFKTTKEIVDYYNNSDNLENLYPMLERWFSEVVVREAIEKISDYGYGEEIKRFLLRELGL